MTKLIFIWFVLAFMFLAGLPVNAQCGGCPPGGVICIPNPLKACTFEELVSAIIGFITALALAVAPLMFIIAGFIFVTGGGNPDSVRTAKNIVLYTVIGLSIILMAGGLINVIKDVFGVGSSP